jgi:hypothetical protein
MNPLVFILTIRVMITHRLCYFHVSTLRSDLLSDLCCILVTMVMAPVIHIETNGCQDLLSHDDAIDDLKSHGWDVFLKKFEGYNLQIAKAFAQTFDGFRAKIGDIQLELTEDIS